MADKFVYFELRAGDTAQAARFYSGVFGWQATPASEDYVMLNAGAGMEGGVAPKHTHSAPVLVYIGVDDIETKLAQIETAGGKIVVGKTLISPEYGYYAVFKDPGGVEMGLWSAK